MASSAPVFALPISSVPRWSKFRFGAGPGYSNASIPAHFQIDPEKFAALKARVTRRLWQESGIDYRALQAQINSCKANPPPSCAEAHYLVEDNFAPSEDGKYSGLSGLSPSGLQLAKLIAYRDSLNKMQTCLSYRDKMSSAFDKEYDPTDKMQELARRNHQFSKNLLQQMADECVSLITPLETKLILTSIPPTSAATMRKPTTVFHPPPQLPRTSLSSLRQLPQLPPTSLSSSEQTLPRLSSLSPALSSASSPFLQTFSLPSSFLTAESFLQNSRPSSFPQQIQPAATSQSSSSFKSLFPPVPYFSLPSGEEDDEAGTTDVADYHSQFSTPALLMAMPWLQNVPSRIRLPLFSPHLDQLYRLN